MHLRAWSIALLGVSWGCSGPAASQPAGDPGRAPPVGSSPAVEMPAPPEGLQLTIRDPAPPEPVTTAPASPDPGEPPEQTARRTELEAQLPALRARLRAATSTDDRITHGFRLADVLAEVAALSDPPAASGYRGEAETVLVDLATDPALAKHRRFDEVLYRAGAAMMNSQPAAARKLFHQLIKNHPTSMFVADGYLAFAEYFFEQNQMSQAEAFYRKVIQLGDPRLTDYARYKAAWVAMNLGDHVRALEGFTQILRSPASAASPKIRREAGRDAVRAYAHVGSSDKAPSFFARLDPERAPELLARLADTYLELDKVDAAAELFASLVASYPVHPDRCRWLLARSRALMVKADRAGAAAAAIGALRPAAGPGDPTTPCLVEARFHGRQLVRGWHRELESTLEPAVDTNVEGVYRALIASGGDDLEAGRDRLYLADVGWRRAGAITDPARAATAWRDLSDLLQSAAALLAGDEQQVANTAAERARAHAHTIRETFGLPR